MSRKKSFLLRATPEIMEALQKWADDELRSVNAQIEYILRGALRKAGRLPSPQADPADPASGQERKIDAGCGNDLPSLKELARTCQNRKS